LSSELKIKYLAEPDVEKWVVTLLDRYDVYAPFESTENGLKEKEYTFHRLADVPDDFCFPAYRPSDPLKSFFTPYIEKVAEYFDARQDAVPDETPVVLFGAKACDLVAHRVQDYVFLGGVAEDPFYRARRDNVLIISGDCTDFKQVCFCLAMDGKPYPEAEFDLNFTPLKGGGFLIECGTDRGRELLEQTGEFLKDVGEDQLAERDDARKQIVDRLQKHLEPQNLPSHDQLQELVKGGMDKDTWSRFAETCVECGACNFVCDTCHCFLLSDRKTDSKNEKIRLWDSCQYANFATVAGGATPLGSRSERLRNRFLKKFDFFVENMDEPACCGCGRCIEACPGEIDIRDVLKDLKD